MVLLRVLSGSMAGTEQVARRFPFRIGRGAPNDLRIDAAGVWDQHCEIACDATHVLRLRNCSAGLTLVNGQPAAEAALRNGDIIDLGELRMQFWISPAPQSGMTLREVATWLGIVSVTALQVALLYWLSH